MLQCLNGWSSEPLRGSPVTAAPAERRQVWALATAAAMFCYLAAIFSLR